MLCLLIGLWINQLEPLSLQTILIHYCQTCYLSQSALQNCNKSKWLRFHSELVFWLLYLYVSPITHAVVLWQQTRHTDLNWTDSKWLKMSGQSRSQTVCVTVGLCHPEFCWLSSSLLTSSLHIEVPPPRPLTLSHPNTQDSLQWCQSPLAVTPCLTFSLVKLTAYTWRKGSRW